MSRCLEAQMTKSLLSFGEISGEDTSKVGGKAANLAKMLQAGLPVPAGFSVGLDAFDNHGKLLEAIKPQIIKLLDDAKLYAVRSSALAEDAEGASWAGQFESFLDTAPHDVIAKIEDCHNSAKDRAKAYAGEQAAGDNFDIAVVVQEMIKPEYAGVLFTQDPLTGADKLVTEYVKGLGEELVSGRADPTRITWSAEEDVEAPFDIHELAGLAVKAKEIFGVAQDIEWAFADGKIWLVQARPITVTQTSGRGYYLGEPEELFYWGPARTKPMYMSDWLAATEQVFVEMSRDPALPSPPKALCLFWDDKMVMLFHAGAFGAWCEKVFEAYKRRGQIVEDRASWQQIARTLDHLKASDFSTNIVDAWERTIFPEFSLYGAESSLAKQLKRFDAPTRQEVWGAFTVPDNSTFLARIDEELKTSNDPEAMARKYPWIQDGYDGLSKGAGDYFRERLKIVSKDPASGKEVKKDRVELAQKLGLSKDEVASLTLARQLAEFMDDRKAWMMQTRRLITESLSDIEYGWCFDQGKAEQINKEDTQELWQRYVNFRASSNAVKGIVASNGGRHFINGEVVVVASPSDAVGNDKILVVPSTSPSYVPLMRNARALITDHGGMMSHAAIVAREFGLPCIVGTKQATKVLKDGDQVVLDLVTGEVNK
jgi:phosphohistidine swiveling domain-containing protein